VQSRDAFPAISAAEEIAAALFKWITGNRGFKRKDGIARQADIGLVRLYVQSGTGPGELIPFLKSVNRPEDLGAGDFP
jgi:hypothetical protein